MSENNTQKQHRLLKISILRYNPADPASVPHMQTLRNSRWLRCRPSN